MNKAMFERDILYPTQKHFEPGSVHVTVYAPENSGRIPVIIEAKSVHNPVEYVPDIIGILQADVFTRIKIDIKECGQFYFKSTEEQHWNIVEFIGKNEYSRKEVGQLEFSLS
jgi:hypothetical protein